MSGVSFELLSYSYPGASDLALLHVQLQIDGGITLLTGASGSGKSTLLRVCNGLIPHFHGGVISGSASVFGQDVARTRTRELARYVGFLFQDPELQAVHTRVERDIAFGLENLRVPRGEMMDRVDEAMHLCGIAALRHRTVSTLSGGERQRVALAGVLAMQPRLLVLDEPLSQLDPGGARAIVDALDGAVRAGTAALVAEHRDRLLRARAARTIAIAAGQLGDVLVDRAAAFAHADGGDDSGGEWSRADVPRARAGAAWQLHGVTAGHGNAAVLHDIHLAARGGEVIGLTGANGSGKTTLLRTLAGLLPALSGRVERAPGRIAYLPQNPTALLHRQTVRAEVEWTLRHDRGDRSAVQVLRDFGLVHVAEHYPRDLSTGERQRAALAAVLAGAPVLALLDEPTRGMDADARAALVRAVRRLAAAGAAVVLATHDQDLARAVAARVVEVRDGRLHEPRVAVMATQ